MMRCDSFPTQTRNVLTLCYHVVIHDGDPIAGLSPYPFTIKHMKHIFLAVMTAALLGNSLGTTRAADTTAAQYYEVRSYLLDENSDAQAIDDYLRDAFLPALGRQGIGPVGVLTNSPEDQSGSTRIVVVIPYDRPGQIAKVKQKMAADREYQTAAAPMFQRDSKHPAFVRIESELLIAMDCMPQLHVSSDALDNSGRVFELRVYESSNEHYGDLKVDMFNNGEVPIFHACGIQPIFIGQGLIGRQTPNLTYLTTYADDASRVKAWDAFRVNPDWQVLKEVEKYKGTVSHIDKYVLIAKPYSQM